MSAVRVSALTAVSGFPAISVAWLCGVVVAPERQLAAYVIQGVADLLVQQPIPQTAVEAFDEGLNCGPATGQKLTLSKPKVAKN